MGRNAAIGKELAMQVRALYEERDGAGRRRHSYRSIGRELRISESTVLRIVNGDGQYGELPPTISQAEIDASASRLLQMLEEPTAEAGVRIEPFNPMKEEGLDEEARARLAGYGYGKSK